MAVRERDIHKRESSNTMPSAPRVAKVMVLVAFLASAIFKALLVVNKLERNIPSL